MGAFAGTVASAQCQAMNQALPQAASAAKFDTSRAAEYETQSRIALAGYDACHELAACLLAASLDTGPTSVLVGGAGADRTRGV